MSKRRWLIGLVVGVLMGTAPAHADFRYTWDVGLTFTGSTFGQQSGFIPPDTMGAVGPNHIVELINGAYRVYDKSTGSVLASSSLNSFWNDTGAGYSGSFAFDPRIVYDPFSERFYASSVDNSHNPNHLLFAVSKSSDPTEGWTGWGIDSDSDDSHWADFDTLGFDADGVYLAANMFSTDSLEARTAVLAIDKGELLGDTPSLVATLWEDLAASDTGYSIQPVLDYDNTGTPARLISAYNSTTLRLLSITGDLTGSPTLSGTAWVTTSPVSSPPDAQQPGSKQDIETNDARLCSNVVLVNGSIWGVQSTTSDGRAALRWFEIDEATNTLLQEGLIADPNMDYYYGSIAVNEFGTVAIGFSGSSETRYASCYVVIGETDGGVTTFGEPMLLHEGVADYQRLDSNGRNRWGDYSATVIDPLDPWTFWTFQEYVAAEDTWAIRIIQLNGEPVPEPTTVAMFALGVAALGVMRQRRRAA